MLHPLAHAERVTGCRQLGVLDAWGTSGVVAAVSRVGGPHVYHYGAVPVPTVAVTLYGVRRHVLRIDGRLRRDDPVLPGRFRIGQPNSDVVVEATPAERDGHLLLIYFSEAMIAGLASEMGLLNGASLRDVTWDTEDPFLHMTARRMAETLQASDPVRTLLSSQLAVGIAAHLLERYAAVPPPAPRAAGEALAPAALRRVKELVDARLGDRLTLPELAAAAGLSQFHFLRRFHAATGMTPHRYVMRQRVSSAQILLTATSLPIAEVALRCGYASQAHLTTAFREATGLTPRQYRSTGRG